MKTHSVRFLQNIGNRNHYYHFFYGVYLPVCDYITTLRGDEPYSLRVESCGEMDRHLLSNPLIPDGCRIVAVHRKELRPTETIRGVDLSHAKMDSFFVDTEDQIRKRLWAATDGTLRQRNKTLVIKRISASGGEYVGESYGASRRYIANIDDVEAATGVVAVAIDGMTLLEQASLFYSADVVVAQHGAALANLYFCRPGTKVIEIGGGGRRCYESLCSLLGLRHVGVASWPKRDGKCFVDPDAVTAALKKDVMPVMLPSDEIAARLPRDGSWAEVGVLEGTNATRVMRQRPQARAHLVDLWQQSPNDSDYRRSGDSAARASQSWMDAAMKKAAARMIGYNSALIRMDSVSASRQFADESLDLVYIDANHTAEAVASDIISWWPKVKRGGWIGGHDYGVANMRWGVKRSVDAFAVENNLAVERGSHSTWFCRKA